MSEINSLSSHSGANAIRILLKLIKFTIISYLTAIVLLAVLAVVIVYTDVSEKISEPSIFAIKMFSAFLAAFLTAKSCHTRGWLCGILTGVFNVVLLMFLGTVVVDASFFDKSNFLLASCGGISGMIGGIIGVNIGNN